jgi:hypothetical protein
MNELSLFFSDSTYPWLPFSIPSKCKPFIEDGILKIEVINNTFEEEKSSLFSIYKEDIISIHATLYPRLSQSEFNNTPENFLNESLIKLKIKDPNGIEDYFEHVFSDTDSYWIKYFMKFYLEKLGLEVEVENKD